MMWTNGVTRGLFRNTAGGGEEAEKKGKSTCRRWVLEEGYSPRNPSYSRDPSRS